MKFRVASTLICLATVTACASPDGRPLTKTPESLTVPQVQAEPFAGVWLADAEAIDEEQAGAVVLGVVAGPASIAGLRANDRIVRIDNIDVDASSATTIIDSSPPGARLTLEVIRDGQPMTIAMIIGSREQWAPPAAFPSAIPFAATGISESVQVPDRIMSRTLAAEPEAEPIVTRLDRMFAELARDDTGYHKLPLIRTAMSNPASMNRWQDELAETLRLSGSERGTVIGVMCKTLALKCPDPKQSSSTAPTSLQTFAQTIADANDRVRAVFDESHMERAQVFADLQYLMRITASDRTLIGQPDVLRGIRAMQISMRLDLASLTHTAALLIANVAQLPTLPSETRQPPSALSGIATGDIVDYVEIDAGYVVVGGAGANHYDMSRLYAVIDIGGNDTYEWSDGIPLETQTIVDLDGDDIYRAAIGGPGAGWLGVSVLIDRAGSDQYESALGGCGAGAFGFGFLFDDSGADTYQCAAWSAGAGMFGGGALVDRGEQTDVYISQVFSQGVGGPRGMGILLDAGGNDVYRANGPVKSAYDTPGSFMAFSQGVGVGIRPYVAGGTGVLLDYAGDDRYEGGEFAQGGGYLWGVGLLRDETGNDIYYGTRYAQGFAAHQAFGMLTDLSGDDTYWGIASAAQGAAWDQSIAILFDAEGDDVYRGHSLSQGAAAQQSRGLLHDVTGDDRYWSSARDTQGAAGSNSYHFKSGDPIYSFGVLFDEHGDDRYSTGVENGTTLLRRDAQPREGRGVAGVVVDLP